MPRTKNFREDPIPIIVSITFDNNEKFREELLPIIGQMIFFDKKDSSSLETHDNKKFSSRSPPLFSVSIFFPIIRIFAKHTLPLDQILLHSRMQPLSILKIRAYCKLAYPAVPKSKQGIKVRKYFVSYEHFSLKTPTTTTTTNTNCLLSSK